MCMSAACPLTTAESHRGDLRVYLNGLSSDAEAGDSVAVAGFLAGMEQLTALNLLTPVAYACSNFKPITATQDDVNADNHLSSLARLARLRPADTDRFLSLMREADSKKKRNYGLEWFARKFWNITASKLAAKMGELPLYVFCGPKHAALVLSRGDKAAQEERVSAVEGLLDTWVGSFSYSRSEGVLGAATSSLQSAAQRFMLRGMCPSSTSHQEEPQTDPVTRVTDAFLNAQYELTQDFFKRNAIKEVTAYRGVAARRENMSWLSDSDDTSVEGVASLSSFSLSRNVAERFAIEHDREEGVVVSATIPVSRILSVPGTGMSNLAEYEIVALTSPLDRVSTQIVSKEDTLI